MNRFTADRIRVVAFWTTGTSSQDRRWITIISTEPCYPVSPPASSFKKVSPLTSNGGDSLTFALLAGSPAIDAGAAAAAPATDQRGHPRPVGLAADIGACEYGIAPRLRIEISQAGTMEILRYDASGPTCRWVTSATLTDCQCVARTKLARMEPCCSREHTAREKPSAFIERRCLDRQLREISRNQTTPEKGIIVKTKIEAKNRSLIPFS